MRKQHLLISLLMIISACTSPPAGEKEHQTPALPSDVQTPLPDIVIGDASTHNKFSKSIPPVARVENGSIAEAYTHEATGGDVYAPPSEDQKWMYGMAFSDPDGHKWNILYMDQSKMS